MIGEHVVGDFFIWLSSRDKTYMRVCSQEANSKIDEELHAKYVELCGKLYWAEIINRDWDATGKPDTKDIVELRNKVDRAYKEWSEQHEGR